MEPCVFGDTAYESFDCLGYDAMQKLVLLRSWEPTRRPQGREKGDQTAGAS
jgi:hypothetical protein